MQALCDICPHEPNPVIKVCLSSFCIGGSKKEDSEKPMAYQGQVVGVWAKVR